MKYIIYLLVFTLSTKAYSQNEALAHLTTLGTGKSLDEAKQRCLYRAIGNTFNVYLNIKTAPKDDRTVAEDIPLSTGIIRDFKTLEFTQLSDSLFIVASDVTVSINSLIKFFEEKGYIIEFSGNEYTFEIQKNILKEVSETRAIEVIAEVVHSLLEDAYSYELKNSGPVPADAVNVKFAFNQKIILRTTDKIETAASVLNDFLKIYSLPKEEIEKYNSPNKPFYKIQIAYNNATNTYLLRKLESVNHIKLLADLTDYYKRRFEVKSEISYSLGLFTENIDYNNKMDSWLSTEQLDDLKRYRSATYRNKFYSNYSANGLRLSFPNKNTTVDTLYRTEYTTFENLKKLKSFKLNPIESKIIYKHSGFVIYENDEYKAIVSPYDVGFAKDSKINYEDDQSVVNLNTGLGSQIMTDENNFGKLIGRKISLLGYDDWAIPDSEILKYITEVFQSPLYRGLPTSRMEYNNFIGYDPQTRNAISCHNTDRTNRIDGYHYLNLRLYRVVSK